VKREIIAWVSIKSSSMSDTWWQNRFADGLLSQDPVLIRLDGTARSPSQTVWKPGPNRRPRLRARLSPIRVLSLERDDNAARRCRTGKLFPESLGRAIAQGPMP
jgi:hypothetical protein